MRLPPPPPLQWLILPDPPTDAPGWAKSPLGHGRTLLHCPSLPVSSPEHGWVTIGTSWERDGLPAERWPGRFWRTDGAILHADPSGLAGVYGDSGVIGSTPSLVAAATGAGPSPRRLGWYSLNWYPPPTTGYRGVRASLPGDRIDLGSGERHAGGGVRSLGRTTTSLDERADFLASELVATLANCGDAGPTALALTAGLDSRLLLAACLEAGLRPMTFTFCGRVSGTTDARIAADLATREGLVHEVIDKPLRLRRPRTSPTAGQHAANADLLASDTGIFERIDPASVVIRGGCFELGRRFFADLFADDDWSSIDREWNAVASSARLGPQARAQFEVGFREWFDLRRDDGMHLAPSDQFYLDSRLGGWLSANELVLDALLPNRIQPANDLAILDCLVDGQRGIGAEVQTEALRRLRPDLLELPINPSGSRLEPLIGRAIQLREVLYSESVSVAAAAVQRRAERQQA